MYDPTCGSGSLLLRVGKETQVYRYFGQERNNTTYNLARMNMLLHDVRYENFDIRNDDTLENPAFLGHTFDAVVRTHHTVRNGQQIQNLKMTNDSVVTANLRSKADFAFIQHGTLPRR